MLTCNIVNFFPDKDNYKELFGALDNAFLVAYAIGMFIRYGFHRLIAFREKNGYYLLGILTPISHFFLRSLTAPH